MLPFHLTTLYRTSRQPLHCGQDPRSLPITREGKTRGLGEGKPGRSRPPVRRQPFGKYLLTPGACQTSGWDVQPLRQKAAPTLLERTQRPATIPRAVVRLAEWTKALGGSGLLCKRRKAQRECHRHDIGAGTLREAEGPRKALSKLGLRLAVPQAFLSLFSQKGVIYSLLGGSLPSLFTLVFIQNPQRIAPILSNFPLSFLVKW